MWMPRHKITAKTPALVGRLGELASEIDDGLLATASAEARGEWALMRGTWPTAADLRTGIIGLSDDELDHMVGKVLRFRSILGMLRGKRGQRPLALLAACA
jgi:hypothetical protein